MKKSFVIKPAPLIFQLILSVGGGFLVGLVTRNNEMFSSLVKPPLTPPPAVFGIAWTIFYVLMAISASLILENKGNLKIYYTQLIVNFLWPIIFFSLGSPVAALVCLLLLIGLVAYMIYEFFKVNKTAALLQIPYFIWLLFALYLNIGFVVLN